VDHQPGDQDPRGYAIKASMGIAERQAPVDNAAFTNMAAVVVLREGVRIAEIWARADPNGADRRRSEIPMRDKAVISHDDYRVDEEKGATPDPLMGHLPVRLSA
jgi:trehalose/maltose hydrolase-like predicted phosphorylase